MSWGDVISAESKNRGGKFPAVAGNPDHKALSKIGSRTADSSDCLIDKHAVVLDMGEGSREQGFRLNGCR
jgi:hypothetical protein